VFAKYRDLKAAAAAAQSPAAAPGTTASSESQQVAPQFLIENNMPAENQPPINITAPVTVAGVPSAPVSTPATPAPPVVTPPSTSPKPPTTTKPPPPAPKPIPKAPKEYKVVHGDTLSAIAARNHTTWQKLFTYNTTPGVRPAATIAELKRRGPNLLYAGETILIPQ
jgi:LysM repeat protein